MAPIPDVLTQRTDFVPETGALVAIAPGIGRVTAPNAGPFTFTGTNSFLIGESRLVVIDPGPNDRRHLNSLLAGIAGRKVEAILLTHTHKDHSALAARLGKLTGAPIWFEGPHRLSREASLLERRAIAGACDWKLQPDQYLSDGNSIIVDGFTIAVVGTPGHCVNHLAFSLGGTPYLFTGDHVMGWNSTLVAPPDGDMAHYLESLEKVIVAPYSHYLPAHGGPIPEGRRYARALLAHRQHRNAQILEVTAKRPRTIRQLLPMLYPDIPPVLRAAASMTLKAHAEYLENKGEVTLHRGYFGTRVSQ